MCVGFSDADAGRPGRRSARLSRRSAGCAAGGCRIGPVLPAAPASTSSAASPSNTSATTATATAGATATADASAATAPATPTPAATIASATTTAATATDSAANTAASASAVSPAASAATAASADCAVAVDDVAFGAHGNLARYDERLGLAREFRWNTRLPGECRRWNVAGGAVYVQQLSASAGDL